MNSGQTEVPNGQIRDSPEEGTIEAQSIMPRQGLKVGHCQFHGDLNGSAEGRNVLISRSLGQFVALLRTEIARGIPENGIIQIAVRMSDPLRAGLDHNSANARSNVWRASGVAWVIVAEPGDALLHELEQKEP
jgi:hypothetical protein